MLASRYQLVFVFVLIYSVLSGCATNPVTGKNQLNIIPESVEINIGESHYLPTQQKMGGLYNIDRELTNYVNEVGQKIALVSDRVLPYEFVVINDSTPNAWALPGGKIGIHRGLLVELNNEAELAAVLSHEIVHAAAKHSVQSLQNSLFLLGISIGLAAVSGGASNAALLTTIADISLFLVSQKYNRQQESEADHYGSVYMARAGYDPQAAATLQETFLKLSEGNNENWLLGILSSHPPSSERAKANALIATTLPTGQLGEERYKKRIKYLKDTKAAYEYYDEAAELFGKNKILEAWSLTQDALVIEPREAHFYSLLGDIRHKQNNYGQAISYYSKALKYNDQFYKFYSARGLSKQALGELESAIYDYEDSLKLLPSSLAYNGLGNIYEKTGELSKAVDNYREASEFSDEIGQSAYKSLVKLDLANNPDDYLQTYDSLNNKSELRISVINKTPLPVHDVQLKIKYRDTYDNEREIFRQFPLNIHADDSESFNIRLTPTKGPQEAEVISIEVYNANIGYASPEAMRKINRRFNEEVNYEAQFIQQEKALPVKK